MLLRPATGTGERSHRGTKSTWPPDAYPACAVPNAIHAPWDAGRASTRRTSGVAWQPSR
jgi:hypothetical protein